MTGDQPVNRLFLLQQEGNALNEVGRLEGLGKPGESIFAVRFIANHGFVVTFERTDPLYALDLSDPSSPLVAGELEVPGFSTYLHPLEDEQLLAVGRDPEFNSTKLSLFDVSDLSRPVEVASLLVGTDSNSEAEYDHHAFTYYPAEHLLALPVTVWNWSALSDEQYGGYDVFAGLHLYRVDPQQGFSLHGKIDHQQFFRDTVEKRWYSPEPVLRSFFIGDDLGNFLYSISRRGLLVSDISDLSDHVGAFDLPSEDVYWVYPVDDITIVR